jgi:uncharacterized protein (TIGR03000 family)
MFRRLFTRAAVPAVVAAVLLAAGAAWARPHGGGGHGGGGHGGGFHGGGFHGGGFHGGFHRGGFHPGGFHGGFHHGLNHFNHFRHFDHFRHFGRGWGGWGWPYYGLGGYGYGYPDYGSTYGTAPGYVDYGSYYPPVDSTGYVAPADYGVAAPAYGAAPAPDNEARITLNVPVDAEVWFDGVKTRQAGPTREFVSPPLTPGQSYTYRVRARWTENGRPVEQERDIRVRANQQTVETFAAGAPGRASAAAAAMPPAKD